MQVAIPEENEQLAAVAAAAVSSFCAFSSIHYYKLLNNEERIILTFSLLGTQSEHQRALSSFQVVNQLSVPLISYEQ